MSSTETETLKETPLNDQVRDMLDQLNATLNGADHRIITIAACQAMSHALALSFQNAVAQQQHSHILRTALTTSAANAILAGKKDEAEAILRLAESSLVTPNLTEIFSDLCSGLKTLRNELCEMNACARKSSAENEALQ